MLYLSFGIPKSGSSFVWQLTTLIASSQIKDSRGALITSQDITGTRSGSVDMHAEALLTAVGKQPSPEGLEWLIRRISDVQELRDSPCIAIIKTHLAPTKGVLEALDSGRIRASATYRHPADTFLSAADYAKRENLDYQRLVDRIANTDIPAFFGWVSSDKTLPIDFSHIVDDPYSVARKIACHLGYTKDAAPMVDWLLSDTRRIFQFNRGVNRRSATEMAGEKAANIEERFPDLMTFIERNRLRTPVIAVVTPVLNAAQTIDETISSVFSQRGSFSVCYHVQDGGSEDRTIEKLRWWKGAAERHTKLIGSETLSFSFSSSPDSGMYEALTRGFKQIDGDFFTWINADDFYMPGAFQSVVSLTRRHPDIAWIIGEGAMRRNDGVPISFEHRSTNQIPSQRDIAQGLCDGHRFPFIQQEGTFWTRETWNAVGKSLRIELRLAGDFELFTRMAAVAKPVRIGHPLGIFRRRPTQLSADHSAYISEVDRVKADLMKSHAVELETRPAPTFVVCDRTLVWTQIKGQGMPSPARTKPAMRARFREWMIGRAMSTFNTDSLGKTLTLLDAPTSLDKPSPESGLTRPFLWLTGSQQTVCLDITPGETWLVELLLLSVMGRQTCTASSSHSEHTVTLDFGDIAPRVLPLVVRPHSGVAMITLSFANSWMNAVDDRVLSAVLLGTRVTNINRSTKNDN